MKKYGTIKLSILTMIMLAFGLTGADAATFTVTNTNDSGAGSLRQAVADANASTQADTINFGSLFNSPQTITLMSEIIINSGANRSNLTINGPGANLLTITGNNSTRLFNVDNTFVTTFSGMTLTGGNSIGGAGSGNGGAIYWIGSGTDGDYILNVSNVVFTGNSAASQGGGLYTNGEFVNIGNTTFTNNSATASSGGGALLNADVSTITNSTFSNNSSGLQGGGLIELSNNSTISNSTFTNNTAVRFGGGLSASSNGSLNVSDSTFTGNTAGWLGGGLHAAHPSINITRSNASGNTVTGTVNGEGGGMYLGGGGTALTVSHSTVNNNTISGGTVGAGGGIFAVDYLLLQNSTVSGNSAVGDGGGIRLNRPLSSATRNQLEIVNSTVSNNTANSDGAGNDNGGGIFSSATTATILGSTISGNLVKKSMPTTTVCQGDGGAIYIQGSIHLTNSTISGNTAECGFGAFTGLSIANSGSTFTNSTIVNNQNAGTSGVIGVVNPGTPTVAMIRNTIIANNSPANLADGIAQQGNNFVGSDAQIAPLANNGGPTLTHALLAGSPSINAGVNSMAVDFNNNPLDFDQRGACFERIVGGTVDLGAYERGATAACGSVPFDYDGDGRSDVSVFRPSGGTWYLLQSTAGFTGLNFGLGTDLLAPADFDGDGKTDVAVFRNGIWFYLQSSNGAFVGLQFGQAGDLPRPGDFDGDGKADINVFRPSNGAWYRLNSSNGAFIGQQFGQNGDKPLIADFDGDGKSDIAVFRPSSNGVFFWLESSTGAFRATAFGFGTDIPTTGDFDGDGKTDIAVFRPSNGAWYRYNSSNGAFVGEVFGQNGDVPVPGDYDGDGKTDIAVFRSGIWYLLQSTSGFTGVTFGTATDKPTEAAYIQ